jgi:hypothetical protein
MEDSTSGNLKERLMAGLTEIGQKFDHPQAKVVCQSVNETLDKIPLETLKELMKAMGVIDIQISNTEAGTTGVIINNTESDSETTEKNTLLE